MSLIKSLHVRNLLSFGSESIPIELQSLNVLIGPNASGKSNLIEALSLLRAAPRNLSAPIKESGGVREWLWKGSRGVVGSIEAVIENPQAQMPLRHSISFIEHGERFELIEEHISNAEAHEGYSEPYTFYVFEGGRPILFDRPGVDERRALSRDAIKPEESILSQVKDPERYPYLFSLSSQYESIHLYREWAFGRYTPPRLAQGADLPNGYLAENCENLALVLNAIRPSTKKRLLEALAALHPGIEDFSVQVSGGRVQLFLEEKHDRLIPATRLSDGTLRYLCLLAILCHPSPPPLICIEEPELGLHPDVLGEIAKLLREASRRTQLIVTTHSDILVDCLSDTPEAVVVCEKDENGTRMRRLDAGELKEWLENYSLGELWRRGQIGGNRW